MSSIECFNKTRAVDTISLGFVILYEFSTLINTTSAFLHQPIYIKFKTEKKLKGRINLSICVFMTL